VRATPTRASDTPVHAQERARWSSTPRVAQWTRTSTLPGGSRDERFPGDAALAGPRPGWLPIPRAPSRWRSSDGLCRRLLGGGWAAAPYINAARPSRNSLLRARTPPVAGTSRWTYPDTIPTPRGPCSRRLLSPGEAEVCRAEPETTAARPEQASQGCPPRRLHPPDCGRLRWAASRAPTRARRRIGWVGPYSLTEPPSPCPVLDRG
jgi:hypothetical protein